MAPPGVGKTSLGQSIARSTNRKFIRMSLGGVRDEAEIRGHRRTYIGSMPGKILQNMTKVGVRNPLFLLDEVDKMGMDFRGDPSSALLEVLDPEQNHTFVDHYVEVEYDLSEVMFVATANTLNIPPALLDRMEVIRLSGYTEDEKVNIAIRYLLPKQRKNNGLRENELSVTESAIRDIIRYFTREAGVRNLERELSKICRKTVKGLLTKSGEQKVTVSARNLDKFLGVRRFTYGIAEKENQVGQVTGLAWTEVGGELLTIEVAVMPGKAKTITTGKLGEVMQESIQAALSVVRSRAPRLGIAEDVFQKNDIHIHLPEGATPKDGPSAGTGICTAMVSALSGRPGAGGRGDDRRDHAARRGAGDRRAEGEAARGAPRPDQDRADPGREREGSGRDPGQHQEPARDHPGEVDRPGARRRARAQARAARRAGRGGARGAAGRRGEAGDRGRDALRETIVAVAAIVPDAGEHEGGAHPCGVVHTSAGIARHKRGCQ